MSGKTLDFDKVKLSKRKFHASKQPINLNSVNANKIVMSASVKHGDEGLTYFTGYIGNEVIHPCVLLSDMSLIRRLQSQLFLFFFSIKFQTEVKNC